MYANRETVLQLIVLLKAHHVRQIVFCPSEKAMPLLQIIAHDRYFTCHSVTDERSAGFFALGLSLNGGKPVAICCASGAGLANLCPTIEEATRQQVPLVFITIDNRTLSLQTQQETTYYSTFKASVALPAIHCKEEEQACNFQINMALTALYHHGKGPVLFQIELPHSLQPIGENELPSVRVIERYQGMNEYEKPYSELIVRLNQYGKRMVLAGPMNQIYLFERRVSKHLYKHFVWFAEHCSNGTVPGLAIKNFDEILATQSESALNLLAPELVITYGGAFTSPLLKAWLCKHPPKEHWHVAQNGEAVDTFGRLTTVFEMDPFEFLEKTAFLLDNKTSEYPQQWERLSKQIEPPLFPYSAMGAVGALLAAIPPQSVLHLSDGSAIRYASFFPVPQEMEICANRENNINGVLSTAAGYAYNSDKINFVIVGDIAFFHDALILNHPHLRANMRILLLNNGGSEYLLNQLEENEQTGRLAQFITPDHHLTATEQLKETLFEYHAVHNEEELKTAITHMTMPSEYSKPILIEVFCDKQKDCQILHTQKTRHITDATPSK